MSSGHSSRTGRAFALLFAPLMLVGTALCGTAATALRAPRTARAAAAGARFEKPLNAMQAGDLPLQRISEEQARAWVAQTAGGRSPRASAPAPPPTTPQFIDLTTTPRPPLVGVSTLSQEIQPAWSWDQQTIFFASNNVDPVANYGKTRPAASALFHIYQMTSDGAFIQQITGTGNNPNAADEPAGTQLYPALNHAQTKLAYAHRPNPASPFELYVLTFSTDPTVPPKREQLTGLVDVNGSLGFNANIVNVEHPSWDPGDNFITFSARNKSITGDVRNVYAINIVSKVVYQVTHGTPANGVEAIDPVFHPSTAVGRITFAANTGNPANGPAINLATGDLNYVANPLKDLRHDGTPDDVDHNLFTVPFTTAQPGPSASAPVQQITTDVADDVEPAYQQAVYPPGQGTGAFNNYLAWSSLGRLPNNQAGLNSYDIYFNNGSSEAASAPIRLFTPDTNAGATPLHQTDERYPTWSSSLPPQNPIDRIAFTSNRQNNVNDLTKPMVGPAGDTDIWAAEVTDITPPTLFPISDYATDLKAQFPAQDFSFLNGEVLHIANAPLPQQGRRIGVPHDTMYFYAKLKDLQYGIDTAWIQIKDPDGPSTDAKGQNHKLYGMDDTNANGDLVTANNVFPVRWTNVPSAPKVTHWMEQPFETDYEGIGATDYQYYSAPKRVDPASFSTWTRYASKDPGVDDSVRWSGNQNSIFTGVSNQPPTDANGGQRWLQLKDDGIFPDLVAGDGIYSAKWVTPDDPSDYYVDLIAYDKAFNPKNPAQQGNWIIYDNIWGFSTQPFSSKNPVLMVDDYGCGQKWPRGLKGSFRTFPTFRYGTESDIMDRPDQYLVREAIGAVPTSPTGFRAADIADIDASAPGVTNDMFHFLDGDSVPYDFISWARGSLRAYRGDLWRILAKGPLTSEVLNDYVPTRDTQPLTDTARDPQDFMQRPVPRRAVLWNAPYTGDIFSGGGTILDQNTQTLLTNYRNQAGRLVVAGGDILWAMTVDGTQPQPFATGVLGANYTGDLVRPDWSANQNGPVATAVTHDITTNPRAFDPLPNPYVDGLYELSELGFASSYSLYDNAVRQHPEASGNANYTTETDGTPFQTQDGLTAASGFELLFNNRMVGRYDAGNTESKTVFLSASLASMGRRLVANGDTGLFTDSPRIPLNTVNYRAKLAHAMFCWMFSADLVGQIRNLNGNAPISGAFIKLTQGGQTVGTAFSKADGTYTVRGLPIGSWNIQVSVPGFATINKAISSGAHGLSQAQADIFLSPAAPGSISGKVTDQFNQPVPNVTVQAHLRTNGLYTGQVDFFAATQADGTYVFPNLPTGSYDVTVANFPSGFSAPQAKFTNPVVVNAAQNTGGTDFTLTAAGGSLTVTVFNQLPDGTKGGPVSGVSVDITDNAGGKQTGTTDAQGKVTFTNVAAGPATVTAFLLNYQEASKTVNIPQQSSVEILLASAAHPVNLYGLVKRAADNQALDTKDISPAITLQLLRKASQQPLPGISADVFAPPAANPVPNNYQFSNAQEGLYTLSFPGNARFNPASVDVNIGSTSNNQAPDLLLVGKDGTVKGKVVDNTGTPVAGATVQLVSKKPVAGTVVLTLTTAADGTFASDPTKLITSDVYDLQVSKFGFTSNAVNNLLIAGDTDAGTITLVRGQRGKVFGLVTRSTDGVPLPGVNVDFYSTLGGTAPLQKVATATTTDPFTGPDTKPANYTIGDTNQTADLLPAGDYTVRVSGDPRFASFSTTLTVVAGQSKRLDITLTPLPGSITGFVKDPTGKAISGATVTVNGKSVTTDSTGKYVTASLQPGQYTVSASAFAFVNNSVNVYVMGPTTAPDLVLQPVPPSTVSGTVRSKADNSAVGGVLIEFLDNTGAVVASTTSTGTVSGSPAANFQLTVAPGTYTVRASKSGWVTATLNNVKVNPNVALTNLSILLDAEHTFGKGLFLISLPYDYPGVDAATVLGQDPATFKSAWYNPVTNSYDIYPNGGAREFRLGKAMFVRFNTPTPFANAASGVPAPAAPFVIDLPAGWNMIGAVRKVPISWVNVRVRTADGVERTMQEAYANNIIQNGLWVYQDGYFQTNTLQPYQGYFVRALQPCSLVIPVDNSTASAGSDLLKMAGAPGAAQVAAELRAAGMAPENYGAEVPVLQAVPALPARKPGSNPWTGLGAFTRPDAWLPRALRG